METGTACGDIAMKKETGDCTIKEIWEDLQKQANYAVASKNKELMYEAYGAAKMARKMCAISAEQMRELNTKLVRNGINNPKTWNAE